jgi:hypothetical protein
MSYRLQDVRQNLLFAVLTLTTKFSTAANNSIAKMPAAEYDLSFCNSIVL